jgi:hypothetical protein
MPAFAVTLSILLAELPTCSTVTEANRQRNSAQ